MAARHPSSRESAVHSQSNPIKKFLKILGPGFISGASNDDPSAIGTYAIAGASLGFGCLWMALFTFPLIAAVQFICTKVGMVSGRGLASAIRQYYPRKVLYPAALALLVANTITAGADIGAIAAAINLLVPIRALILVVPITAVILALQILGS